MSVSTHEELRQLCALSTSACLTDEERTRLEMHLEECPDCRIALREYDRVAKVVMPGLADDFPVGLSEDTEDWSEEAARDEFFARLDSTREQGSPGRDPHYGWGVRRINLKSPEGKARISPARLAIPYVAAVVLAGSIGWLGYRIGIQRSANPPAIVAQTPARNVGTTVDPIAVLSKERASLSAEVAERNRAIAHLSDQVARQAAEVEKLTQEQQSLRDSLQKAEAERDQKVSERQVLDSKLEQAQAELLRAKNDLETLQKQRADDALRQAQLEARLAKFSDQLKESDATIDEQRDLLARDRDIRDLISARKLYIGEVEDVGRDGRTKKPVGRVFYTKEKSLIFYAYDLDQQPGLRNASIFQVWGRRGPDLSHSMNLGIFYEDNAAHKRWVLKFNDAKAVEQIDAVFVTVEPKGGSQKPTGKPFLFTYLRVEPNHP